MPDQMITFSADINLGQLGVIFSIAATGIGIYIKSKLDVQKLSLESSETKADLTELKAGLHAIRESHSEIKAQLAANTALISMNGVLKDLPGQLAAALRSYVDTSARERGQRHEQQQQRRDSEHN